MILGRSLLAGLLVAFAGCDNPDVGGLSADAGPDDPRTPAAYVTVHALDIWARPLADGTLTVRRGATMVTMTSDEQAPIYAGGTYQIDLSAPDHVPAVVQLVLDSTGVSLERDGSGAGVSYAASVTGDGIPVHHVYVGLAHRWFSATGRPPRAGNDVRLLMDGEEAWGAVHETLSEATESVLIATWWWDSIFELVRPGQDLTTSQRRANTILGVLESLPAVRRVLVGQFYSQDGVLSNMTSDDAIRAKGAAPGDRFEFMGQANESAGIFQFTIEPFTFGARVRDLYDVAGQTFQTGEPQVFSSIPSHQVDLTDWPVDFEVTHASYHQKFLVADDTAFVGGMNYRPVDWDTNDHLIFDHRRMDYDATAEERNAVAVHEELPDNGPRKDYMVRIQGPAVQDVVDIFKQRWDLARLEGADYAANSSEFEVNRDLAERGDVTVQITATLPDPLWEHSIAETWVNAVANAREYIYIEDQYFRAPLLNDAIVRRMSEVPGLRLVVITKPIAEWTDPGCAWTYRSDALFKQLFPDRYKMLKLRSFDWVVTWGIDETESRFQDIDVHAKMLIVDDIFLSVGSANKNNRGMVYEGEMNAAVLDAEWVRAARRRIFANLMPGAAPTDDVEQWWDELADHAAWNDAVYARWDDEGHDINLNGSSPATEWLPVGFVYGQDFPDVSECLMEDVGPDMT
jgi:phosphatidylserine/phosphatidylglycerophosphate/cardiolipin synthase-like enzyme